MNTSDSQQPVQDVTWRDATPPSAEGDTAASQPPRQPAQATRIVPPRRPSWAFMRQHPAHWIALGAGSGLSPMAPGTLGTLWAWAVWALLVSWWPMWAQGLLLALAIPAAWWACTRTAANLGVADPGNIVADEVVAFWLVLWLIQPTGLGGEFIAFVLFRWLDAQKPGPVGWADRLLHGARGWRGGWGIMFDDLVAAFCVLLLVAGWRWFMH